MALFIDWMEEKYIQKSQALFFCIGKHFLMDDSLEYLNLVHLSITSPVPMAQWLCLWLIGW